MLETMLATSVTTLRMEVRELMVEPRVERTSVAGDVVSALYCSGRWILLTDSDNSLNRLQGSGDLAENQGNSGVQVNKAANIDDLAGLEGADGAGNGSKSVCGNIASGGNCVGGDGDHVPKNIRDLVDDLGDELGDGRDLNTDV